MITNMLSVLHAQSNGQTQKISYSTTIRPKVVQ